jgi:hypothetical protein
MWRSACVQGERRKGNQRANAQQSLLESAAIARRAERRRLAGMAAPAEADNDAAAAAAGTQPGSGQAGEAGDAPQPQPQQQAGPVQWVGCQWLMDGYCGRAQGDAAGQQGDGPGPRNSPQRPNRAA